MCSTRYLLWLQLLTRSLLLLLCQVLASYCSSNKLSTSSPGALGQAVPSAWKPLPPDSWVIRSHLVPVFAHRSPAQWGLPCPPSPQSPTDTLITSPGQVGPWPLVSSYPSSFPFFPPDRLKALLVLGKMHHPQVSGPTLPSAWPLHTVGFLQASPGWGTTSETLFLLTTQITASILFLSPECLPHRSDNLAFLIKIHLWFSITYRIKFCSSQIFNQIQNWWTFCQIVPPFFAQIVPLFFSIPSIPSYFTILPIPTYFPNPSISLSSKTQPPLSLLHLQPHCSSYSEKYSTEDPSFKVVGVVLGSK